MQQRRLRPGDVLDDYCPRERRITDHAIVAMIDDHIKQTRCVSCDAEHEYKQARVPPQRRKKPALFNQVLDGLGAPTRPPSLAQNSDASFGGEISPPSLAQNSEASFGEASAPRLPDASADNPESMANELTYGGDGDLPGSVGPAPAASVGNGDADRVAATSGAAPTSTAAESGGQPESEPAPPQEERLEGPVRRQLIRAALPRPEGQPPPSRVMPEFTMRQPMNGRSRRGGGRRRHGPHQQQSPTGPMRFGRGAHGQRSNGQGRPGGPRRRGGKKGR